MSSVVNVNVGILGHVDSGKTSLARILSQTLSTAALDKHPQSRERGITQDLGFSAFRLPVPSARRGEFGCDQVQVTLVDCPGHSSLIRTVIGGARIIDLMLLVLDVTKGIQTQTSECIVIGEVTKKPAIVVLNKADLLPGASPEAKAASLEKARGKIAKALGKTAFKHAPTVVVSATGSDQQEPDVSALVQAMQQHLSPPLRETPPSPFIFEADHCFQVKGKGQVVTGTVVAGCARLGDPVSVLAAPGQDYAIKGIQVFRESVDTLREGDRAGVLVTGLDASSVERTIVCTPGAVPKMRRCVALVRKLRFFRAAVRSGDSVHLTIGHSTVMARVFFFGALELSADRQAAGGVGAKGDWVPEWRPGRAFQWQAELLRSPPAATGAGASAEAPAGAAAAAGGGSGSAQPPNPKKKSKQQGCVQWCLMELASPVNCPADSLLIGSRLDFPETSKACRIAFAGHVAAPLDEVLGGAAAGVAEAGATRAVGEEVRLFRHKARGGRVDRVPGATTGRLEVIASAGFDKRTDFATLTGQPVRMFGDGDGVFADGTIEGSFGKSGKFRVLFPAVSGFEAAKGLRLEVQFRRYVFGQGGQ